MATVSLRKQGGALVMTVPAEIVQKLEVTAGDCLDVTVESGTLVARPTRKGHRKYTLDELLDGATPEAMAELHAETAWARDGDNVGREL
jgi:antitoxin ChpS